MTAIEGSVRLRLLPTERPLGEGTVIYLKRLLTVTVTAAVAGVVWLAIAYLCTIPAESLLGLTAALLVISVAALALAITKISALHAQEHAAAYLANTVASSRRQLLLEIGSQASPQLTEFQQLGFLSATSEHNAVTFLSAEKEWVRLYLELNRLGQRALLQIAVNNTDAQRILSWSVFYRLLTTYQSVFLLVQRGVDLESKVLLRTMTEGLMVFVAAAKSIPFAKRYIRSDEDTRRKLLEKTLRHVSERGLRYEGFYMPPLHVEEMQSELEALNRRRAANELEPEMRKEDIAAEAGLLDLYLHHFAYFSLFTHLTPSGMRDLVRTDDKGVITQFRFGVNYDDAFTNLRVSMVLMISALLTANPLFQLEIQSEILKLQHQLSKLLSRTLTTP